MRKIVQFLLFIIFGAVIVKSQQLTPQEIIQKIDDTERVMSSQSKFKQTIVTSGGDVRTLEAISYSKNKNEKQLMIYEAPNRVKGDKILMLNDGDDIWFYTPKTDRVRHLASHAKRQKVQGSDFSYEDMAGGSLEEDYTYKFIGEEVIDGRDCYKIELTPKPEGPSYSKLILWADKERYISIQIEYFEDGELTKRLSLSDIVMIDDHWTAQKIVMKNLMEGGETIMETDEIQFDIDIDEKIFTTKNLKKR
ncbi:MAG: outer membrane lipoprotein-sorting protein [Bacteroidetes bacterium]|nr:outer membrane lipoprotein-sorting protein [Bacteroidota bacterium]